MNLTVTKLGGKSGKITRRYLLPTKFSYALLRLVRFVPHKSLRSFLVLSEKIPKKTSTPFSPSGPSRGTSHPI